MRQSIRQQGGDGGEAPSSSILRCKRENVSCSPRAGAPGAAKCQGHMGQEGGRDATPRPPRMRADGRDVFGYKDMFFLSFHVHRRGSLVEVI